MRSVVRAIWSASGDGQDTETRALELSYDGRVVQMYGGPTGYESFVASDFLKQQTSPPDMFWSACAGTPGLYARCQVPAVEMARALREMGVIK